MLLHLGHGIIFSDIFLSAETSPDDDVVDEDGDEDEDDLMISSASFFTTTACTCLVVSKGIVVPKSLNTVVVDCLLILLST